MLRSDFDNHSLWATLNDIEAQLATIAEQNNPSELPDIGRVQFQINHVRGFSALASTQLQLFAPEMLETTRLAWTPVANDLSVRISGGEGNAGYVSTAADRAENALVSLGPWPRPYARGAQVTQMNTLFEGLMESQRHAIERLTTKHEEFESQMESFSTAVEVKRDEAVAAAAGVSSELVGLQSQIEADKTVVTDAVAAAETAVANLTDVNTEAFEEWKTERSESFNADFEPLLEEIGNKLASADAEYAELISAKKKYTNLVSRIAGDEVAERFAKESRFGRGWGIGLYILGALLIIGAGVPLVVLIFDHSIETSTEVSWNRILIRVAIGVLAGSAATILIRLGGRFLNNANDSKRMELELKAIGPFLANVHDEGKVDKAMVDLVDRAFGKTYGGFSASKGAPQVEADRDDAVPIEVANKLISLVADAMKRLPPTT